jgi:hypothetical protein
MKQKNVFQQLTINILVVFVLTFFVSSVQAAEIPAPTQKNKVTVAMVDVYNAKIVSQDKNKFKLFFDLSNHANIQPDVKYAVRLVKEEKGIQVVMDEQIYPEAVNLGENETIPKEIAYVAPAYLSGNLQLWIVARNQNGLMLAMVHPGDVILNGDGQYAEINAKSCFLKVDGEAGGKQYTLGQGVDIKNEEKLIATCEITNHSSVALTATPKIETHWRTTFGRVVPDNQEPQKVLALNPQEKKQVSFTLSKAIMPQAYDAVVNLANTKGDVISNKVVFHYVLRGASATIQNLRLDKDYYQKGDTAKASFFWTPSADSFPGSRFGATDGGKLFVTISIKDKNNANCTTANGKKELDSKEKTPSFDFPITTDCLNPQISVAIQDAKGLILDQNDYKLISKSVSGNATIDGEEWLIKFRSTLDPQNVGQIEYEYSLLAKKCGIEMPETRLFEGKYFGVKRFDRKGKTKIHMLSAAALLNADYRLPSLDYQGLLTACLKLTSNIEQVYNLYRIMVFNFLIRNRDDHAKNFSFLLKDGNWELSPAYDMLPSNGFNGFHTTTIAGQGEPKRSDIHKVSDSIGLNKTRSKEIYDMLEEKCHNFRIA